MKICAACCNELPQSSFSKKQWKLKQYERRCTDCIAANRVLQLKPPPKTTNKEEDTPTCYICLDDGPDELGGEVMRDCSCRGSAGYVHISCAANYAEKKCTSDAKLEEDPWDVCPNCHQQYRNDLAIGMSKKRVIFVEKYYSHDHTLILFTQVGRLESLTSKNHGRSYTQTKEAEQVANSIIHKVGQMKVRGIPITEEDRVYEAYAYEILGCMIMEEGVKRKFPNALRYLEKSLEVSMAINFSFGITRRKGLIDKVKSELSGQVNDGSLKSHKMMYEQKLNAFGKSSIDTIKSGMHYGKLLKYQHLGVKAERLFIELYEISTRYHGSDHEITKDVVVKKKDYFRSRVVSITPNEADRFHSSRALSVKAYSDDNDNVEFYRFLEYDGSFDRCIVKGPLFCSDDTTNNEVSLSTNDIIFALGTPVTCHGMECVEIEGQLGDVRAWNHETKCYTIYWEDESLDPCEVHQSNIRIPSCICNNCMKGLDCACTFLLETLLRSSDQLIKGILKHKHMLGGNRHIIYTSSI